MRDWLKLYSVWHCNLGYSSIEVKDRTIVLERCYWPLLELAQKQAWPISIEMTGQTLEWIWNNDRAFITRFKQLMNVGLVELVASGRAQIIGPLVPARVNHYNLQLGLEDYDRFLGARPKVALVNEQAFSKGLVDIFEAGGFDAFIMEWNNPATFGTDVDEEHRYHWQMAKGVQRDLPVIWNDAIAFQQFQRYVHGEQSLALYMNYLCAHQPAGGGYFPLYGNDVEIFGFRPGRYHTEAAIEHNEWSRIDDLICCLRDDNRFSPCLVSDVLKDRSVRTGNPVNLQSAAAPVPVKKQGKYNVTRWAVTGIDDLTLNTRCSRLIEPLGALTAENKDDWRQLCDLFASDLRTHITPLRYQSGLAALQQLEQKIGSKPVVPRSFHKTAGALTSPFWQASLAFRDHLIEISTGDLSLVLNKRRGLSITGLGFPKNKKEPLIGTLPHGYFSDMQFGADFYSGHMVLETPGRPKVTDLQPVEPTCTEDDTGALLITARLVTSAGPINKQIRVPQTGTKVDISVAFDFDRLPLGRLRFGYLTANPAAFSREQLFYKCCNGGDLPVTFTVAPTDRFDHGASVSFLVSATTALGLTDGRFLMGDHRRAIEVEFDRSALAVVGMVTFNEVDDKYFYRFCFSAREMDETCRPEYNQERFSHRFTYSLRPRLFSC